MSPGRPAAACAGLRAWRTLCGRRPPSGATRAFPHPRSDAPWRRSGPPSRCTRRPAPSTPPRSGCPPASMAADWLRSARMSDGTTRSISSRAPLPVPAPKRLDGAVLLTSRVSVELVQKTAQMGAAVRRRGLGAHRARRPGGRGRRHHDRGHRPLGRVRGVHASPPDRLRRVGRLDAGLSGAESLRLGLAARLYGHQARRAGCPIARP